MEVLALQHTYNFKCINKKCPDTCCVSWDVVVDEKSADFYRSCEGHFAENLKNSMTVDENSDIIFKAQNGRCPFLNEENLCDIYINLGEEHLCHTCALYPRFTDNFGTFSQTGLSLSCPEAVNMYFSDKNPLKIICSNNSENETFFSAVDYKYLSALRKAMFTIIKILQNRTLALSLRIGTVLDFCCDVQDKIDELKTDEILKVCKNYSNINISAQSIASPKQKNFDAYLATYKYVCCLKNLEILSPEWEKILTEKPQKSDCEDFFKEHILVYFIFRYFLKAADDSDVISKVKFALHSLICITSIPLPIKDACRMYSKEIEHCRENIEALYCLYYENEIFAYENLKEYVLNNF